MRSPTIPRPGLTYSRGFSGIAGRAQGFKSDRDLAFDPQSQAEKGLYSFHFSRWSVVSISTALAMSS